MIVQCTSCRARFNAPDEFAGRKVRCRKCHTILIVPRVGARAGGHGKDALYGDELESLDDQGGSGRAGLDLVDPDELFQSVSSEFDAPRSNALYAYPMSGQIDRWLPVVLALAPFAWVCTQAFTTASAAAMPGWVGALRLFAIVALFFLVVLPTSYAAVRYAARKCNYVMPAGSLWRVGAVFSLPYMLAAAMWLIAAGQASGFVTGCLVGLFLALPALWLLLRLDPEEGPLTLSIAGGAFVASTAVAAGVVVFFSILANASADPATKPTAMRENPLGPGLRWDVPPEQPKPSVAHKTMPSTETPQEAVVSSDPLGGGTKSPGTQSAATTPSVPRADPFAAAATQAVANANPTSPPPIVPQPTPPTTRANADPLAPGTVTLPPSPLVASTRVGFTGRYDAVLSPPAPRSYVAVMTHPAEGQSVVTRWNVTTWRPAGEATFLGRPTDFHLSADGALVARVVTFPNLSLQVYSFLERRFRDPVKLDGTQGEPTILGFAGPSLVLIQWKRADDQTIGLEVIDAMAGKWTKRIPRIGNFECQPGRYVISDDGRLVALLTRDPSGGPGASIELYSLETTERLAKTIVVKEVSWNDSVRISGLAVSPGRTEVSLLLENEGRGLMLTWDVETGKPTRQHLEQAGLAPVGIDTSQFQGNALSYVDGGNAWLIYGASIYDVANGQRLGALNLPTPLRQWTAGGTCYVYRNSPEGFGVLQEVRIDTKKLRAMLAKRGQP